RPLALIPPAWLAALVYSALAGFGVTVVRALLMISVVLLATARRRAVSGLQTLSLAFVVLLVWQPLAVLSASFWLSFAGVAFLVLCLRSGHGWRAWLLELGAAQWLMTIGLLPLTVWFFGQSSLLAPLANLLAVPMIGLLVTPLTLAGSLALLVWAPLASGLLHLAAWTMHWTWWCMQALAALPMAQVYWPQPSLVAFILALLGAIWLLLPRGVPLRVFGVLLLLPLLHPPSRAPRVGGFVATVVDVGQGLSVIVRTRHHALVYDAGPRYPSGYDLGRVAVVPTLHAEGIGRLDMLLISHGDNDHAGGGPAIAAAYPHAYEMGSEPKRSHMPLVLCRAGQHWRWDGVDFRMVFPGPGWNEKGNNGSCVLLVSGRGGRLLLPGDIEALVEPDVAKAVGPGPPLVLVVPHHGSDTSSSAAFIAALQPCLALNSAGYRNRFGHPRALVLKRYHDAGVPFYNTASAGALMVAFAPDAAPKLVLQARLAQRRYWRE
ncbi:MAG: DNA internalization-related competence protein ComEC/Rec2, partial [Xanthomonadales bacterium]|nr:DNA internalization-related competence protein ComEC/Rec2 [Xanthomonadales bacterium]